MMAETGPLVIELIGLPASGKTTIARAIAEQLNASGRKAVTFPADARMVAERSRIGRLLKLLTFGVRQESVGWAAYRVATGLGTLRFIWGHPRALLVLLRENRSRPDSAAIARRRPLYWMLRHAGDRMLFGRIGLPDEVLIADEGFAHRVVQLFASPEESPEPAEVGRYLEAVEPADLYVQVRVPASIAADRLRARGRWDWLPRQDVDRFLSSADSAISAAGDWLRSRGRAVTAVDNLAPSDVGAASLRVVSQLGSSPQELPRVLMLCRLFHPWVGGMERQALKLARTLQSMGVEVTIATGWWFRGTPRSESIEGVPVVRNFTFWEFSGIRGVRRLGHYLYMLSLMWYLVRNRHRYDVIHVHGLSYHTFIAARLGRLLGRPVIAKLANSGAASDILKLGESSHLPGTSWMLGGVLDCDRMVAISGSIETELIEAGVDPDRIVRIPNGVDIPDLTGPRHESLPRLLFLGRLHSQKGLTTLLEALYLLRDRSDVTLDLVGDGPERRSLEAHALDLGVRSMVEFHGEHPDVSRFLASSTALVLPSNAEGLSNSLLEAMAAGLPVIVSDIPANTAVVEHGVEGLVFASGDAEDLASCISKLVDDPSSGRGFGASARARVESEYRIELVAARYLQLYRELIGGRSR